MIKEICILAVTMGLAGPMPQVPIPRRAEAKRPPVREVAPRPAPEAASQPAPAPANRPRAEVKSTPRAEPEPLPEPPPPPIVQGEAESEDSAVAFAEPEEPNGAEPDPTLAPQRIEQPARRTRTRKRPTSPLAYRSYVVRNFRGPVDDLDEATRGLIRSLHSATPHDLRNARKQAEKIEKLSRKTWKHLQLGSPTRQRREPQAQAEPRPLSDTRDDALLARRLFVQIVEGIRQQAYSGAIDVRQQLEILGRVERLESLAHQIRADLTDR